MQNKVEIAYGFLRKDLDPNKNPLDAHYEQLKCDIRPIEHDSEEYKMIEKYAKSTHGPTHTNFAMEIEDVYKVDRWGEDRRYKPFKKLHNRQLLWHGSHLTNYVGILSHGFNIAPPEAPTTG